MQSFQRIVILLSKTSGRDKSCRILQYFGKYLAEQLKELKYQDAGSRCQLLSSNMSMTRKVLRFGRTIGILITIQKMIKQQLSKEKQNDVMMASKILMNLSALLYFVVDHIHWICKVQIMNNPELESKADWLSDTLWFFEALFDCIATIIEIQTLRGKADHEQIKALEIDLLRAVMDLFCAYGFSTGRISGKMIGAMGTVSSIIGLKQQWEAAK